MLKEVMLGSGGIMLAAAIFASSVTPAVSPASPAPAQVAPVAVAPAAAPLVAAPSPQPVFPEETGDMTFGAPMIEAAPIDTELTDPAVLTAAPDSAEESGGRQFYSRPGRPYPTPE